MPVPTLLPHQLAHAQRMDAVLAAWPALVDTSPVGAGKTYTACRYAREHGLAVLVVGPKSIHSKWRAVAAAFAVPVLGVCTYQGLRARRGYQPTLPYLRRRGDEFHTDPTFDAAVADGVLLVFDEFQNVKNPGTAQIEAAAALAHGVYGQPGCRSRVVLLSASPGDKKGHAFQFVRMLGITAHSHLHVYDLQARELLPLGIHDLEGWCAERDAAAREAAGDKYVYTHVYRRLYTAAQSRDHAYLLFCRYVLPLLASAMPAPPLAGPDGEPFGTVFYNGFFRLSRRDQQELARGVEMLRKAVRPILEGRPAAADTMGRITNALIVIETAKRDLFVRLARERLEAEPGRHVVVLVNYLQTVEYVARELHAYRPVRFVGSMNTDQRDAALYDFMEPSAVRRLFVGTVAATNVGIDLDDKAGDLPRTMLISPDYKFIPIYQAMGRVARASTQSQPEAFVVYGAAGGQDAARATEVGIMDSLARKTEVAAAFVVGDERPPFPGELPSWVE